MSPSKRLLYPLGLVASLALVVGVARVIAAPPGSVYTPGETLAPTCAPGDSNCTVTAPMAAVTPGTSGNVLTSNGTNWTSAAPAGGGLTMYSMSQSISLAELNAAGATTSLNKNFASAFPANARIVSITHNVTQQCAAPGLGTCTAYVELADGMTPGAAWPQNQTTAVAEFSAQAVDFRSIWGGQTPRIHYAADVNLNTLTGGALTVTVWYVVAAP